MSKYNNNNYFRTSGTDEASMRFNKRPRYGANNSQTRFSQSNSTSYNYQQNRNNSSQSTGQYQNNINNNTQYDRGARNYYGRGSMAKRPLHKQQPSNFERQNHQSASAPAPASALFTNKSNVSRTISASSTSPAAAAAAAASAAAAAAVANTIRKLHPPTIPTAGQSANASQIPNQQLQCAPTVPPNIPDKPFGYNNYFYPNYNADAAESALTSSYGMNYNISQYMWQTITSTPPPNLLVQPPLPQQSPPTKLPPLPGADATHHNLQYPPGPFSSLLTNSSTANNTDYMEKNNESRNDMASKPVVKIKAKRKAMSTRYNASRNWRQEDAELALKVEEEVTNKQTKDTILILRFPDPEINRDVVKNFNPAIESVHFQLNFAPRYCFVHLKPDTNVQETVETLSKIPFGCGFITAEIKDPITRPRNTNPIDIDPCTLYVGNLPNTVACTVLKEHFPGACRIDIGFAQRMKYTRYAFIRYKTVEQSIEAYKRMIDAEIGGRSVLIRFRRTGTQRDDQKDDDIPADEYTVDDFILPSATENVAENETSTQVSQKQNDIINTNAEIDANPNANAKTSTASRDINTDVRNNVCNQGANNTDTTEINQETNNESNPQTTTETIENNTNSTTENNEAVTNNTTVPLVVQNIKPDPDNDPDDKVVSDETIKSRFDYDDQRVKQEKETVTDFEFFAPAVDQHNDSTINTTSLSTSTEDWDDTNEADNSLSAFLTTCQREESTKAGDDENGRPATKSANKSLLEKEIKKEPIEEIDNDLMETTTQKSNVELTTIKQELNTVNEDLNNKTTEDINDLDILPEDNFLQSLLLDKSKTHTNRTETSTISNGSSNLKRQNPKTSKDNTVPTKTLRLENERQLNNTNNNNEETTNSYKPKSSALNQSLSRNLQKDNDDVVPTSALFLRNDIGNSANEMYDDEFFATKSQNSTTPLADVKQEPRENANDLNGKANTTADYSKRGKEKEKENQEFNARKSRKTNDLRNNHETVSADEDDVVPTDNCLLSRQLLSPMDFNSLAAIAEVKREKELDDLFSTPFKKTSQERMSDKSTNAARQQPPNHSYDYDLFNSRSDNISLNVNNKENSSDNSATDTDNSSAHNLQNSTQVSNKGANEYDEISTDDDLIIISENFPPIPTTTIITSPTESQFLGQSELLTFKRKPKRTDNNVNSLYGPIHESSSKLKHHDNLDKLFQQLDSDSDNEL